MGKRLDTFFTFISPNLAGFMGVECSLSFTMFHKPELLLELLGTGFLYSEGRHSVSSFRVNLERIKLNL
jgi:hypothetical protein